MKKIIAVVDDDKPILEVVTLILEEEGFKVLQYQDGDDLLNDLGKEQFHLVLLDYRLPRKNGVEIAKEIKAKVKSKKIPVIIISANRNIEYIKKLDSVDDFIAKPFDIGHLIRTIQTHLALLSI